MLPSLVKTKDVKKITLKYQYDCYEYIVTSLRVTNVLTIFMSNFSDKFMTVFIDDIFFFY